MARFGISAAVTLIVSTIVSTASCSPSGDAPSSGASEAVLVNSDAESSRRALAAPISGGTLALNDVGDLAVVADPDNDRIWVVDLTTPAVRGSVTLPTGSEPGRVVLDRNQRAHVVLRGTGEIVSFSLNAISRAARRPVCIEPRGIAADVVADQIVVACASGEVVWLPPVGEEVLRRVFVEPDLRDVIIRDGAVVVSKFRSAELLTLNADGSVHHRERPDTFTRSEADGRTRTFEPFVGWRLVEHTGDRGFTFVHQRGQNEAIDLEGTSGTGGSSGSTSPYGGSPLELCSGILHSAVTTDRGDGNLLTTPVPGALPVDVAVHQNGMLAIVSAGSHQIMLAHGADTIGGDPCSPLFGMVQTSAQPVAVQFDPEGQLIVQMRNPTQLETPVGLITLDHFKRDEPGHTLFHQRAGTSTLACASCHPEGGEDGRVWNFAPIGPRRTQMLAGGLTQTAPFHWDGDLDSIEHLVSEVFVRRMGGEKVDGPTARAMLTWLDSVRLTRIPSRAGPEAVERGRALFHDAQVGCASCHSGPLLTNNAFADVGTGGVFQVPALRELGTRSRFMHDGCAETLADRFGPCGGGDRHGVTSGLTEAQRADLVAFLETL